MTLQLAKNIYPCGILGPARNRVVRLPRLPLPSWFLALRRGAVSQGQQQLDVISSTPLSWARWSLFGEAAVFAAMANFHSISVWATALSGETRSSRPGKAQSDSHQGQDAGKFVERSSGLVEHGSDSRRSHRGHGHGRRNSQCDSAAFSLPSELHGFMAGPWSLLTTWETLCSSKCIRRCPCRCYRHL